MNSSDKKTSRKNQNYGNPRVIELVMNDPRSKEIHFQGLYINLLELTGINYHDINSEKISEYLQGLHDWQIFPLLEFVVTKKIRNIANRKLSCLYDELSALLDAEIRRRELDT